MDSKHKNMVDLDLSVVKNEKDLIDECVAEQNYCDDIYGEDDGFVKEEMVLEDYEVVNTNGIDESKPNICMICNSVDFPTENETQEQINVYCDDCYNNDFNENIIAWKNRIHRFYVDCVNCLQAFKFMSSIKNHNCRNINLYFCKRSDLIFEQDRTLHFKQYKNRRKNSCNVCRKWFSTKTKLELHLMKYKCEKPYSCKICGKYFYTIGKLNRHLTCHKPEKKFSCKICGKLYTRNDALRRHFRVHSNDYYNPFSSKELGFTCSICEKSFTSKDSLKGHIERHSSEQLYACDICGKGFTKRDAMRKHLLTHSKEKPYSCKICNKCFNRKDALKKHSLIHSKEKPYKCNVCGVSCNRKDALKSHIVRYIGKKYYTCKMCCKSFHTKEAFSKHKLGH